MVVELNNIVRGGEPYLATCKGDDITYDSVHMARHLLLRGSYIASPLRSLPLANTRKHNFTRSCRPYTRKYTQGAEVRLTSGSQ